MRGLNLGLGFNPNNASFNPANATSANMLQWILSTESTLAQNVSGSTLLDTSPDAGDVRDIQAGKCYVFDGSDDYIDIGNEASSIKSICFRIKPDSITTHTDYVIDLNGTDYITIVNGEVTVNGFSAATVNIYVDGAVDATIPDIDDFHDVIITSSLGFTASDLDIGRLEGTGFFGGKIYDIRLFTSTLSSAERTSIDAFESVTDNLACWYKCDESAGTTSYDSSGNSSNGTITNATLSTFHGSDTDVLKSWQNDYGYSDGGSGVLVPRDESDTANDVLGSPLDYTGRVPYNALLVNSRCATFDGANNYISTGISTSATSGLSIAAWIKPADLSHHNTIWSALITMNFRVNRINGLLTFTTDGIKDYTSSYAVSANETVHVAVVFDNSFDCHFYINGVFLETVTGTSGVSAGTRDVEIGRRSTSLFYFFEGLLYDVVYYEGEWDATDIALIYAGQEAVTGQTFRYPIAEGWGTKAYDVSGNDNHGTCTNITESSFWANTQNQFNYNFDYGFEEYDDDATGLNIIRVPYQIDGTQLTPTISGYTKNQNNPAGNFHNNCETQIDFTGGVASPASVAGSWESAYTFDDYRAVPRYKNQISSIREENFLAYDAALSKEDANSLSGYFGVSLPSFAVSAKIITIGDSITSDNNYADDPLTKISNQGDGIITWAIRDIPGFQHLIWSDTSATHEFRGANFGIQGDTATGVAARTTPMINTSADIAILLIGTNTGATDVLPATVLSKIDEILEDLVNGGMHVILGTILPRAVTGTGYSTTISAALMQRILTINEGIRARKNNYVTIWDAWNDMVDPQYVEGVDDEYGTPLAGLSDDGVHLIPVGAYTAAQSLRTILRQMIPTDLYDDTWFNSDPTDASNRILNGEFDGTSGFPQYGVTGTVATNWVVRSTDLSPSYTSGVASLVANTDTGGYSQKLVLTCDGLGASDGYEQYYFAPLAGIIDEGSITDGAWVQLMFKIRVENNDDGILGSLTGRLLNQTQSINAWGMEWTNTFQAEPWPVTDFEGWIVTEPLQYSTGNVFQIYLYANIMENFAGTVDVYCDAAILIEVGDPTSEFPYTP